ncbi:unnamed protein product [Cuscuta campestris]|uniref:Uncharacterized protein n=1 Tax=Cuscuta campestris TaxID=132261 RepID=A0A484LJ54_9ASTE|nr:unnamed protein product [Cuscuta campestris]
MLEIFCPTIPLYNTFVLLYEKDVRIIRMKPYVSYKCVNANIVVIPLLDECIIVVKTHVHYGYFVHEMPLPCSLFLFEFPNHHVRQHGELHVIIRIVVALG